MELEVTVPESTTRVDVPLQELMNEVIAVIAGDADDTLKAEQLSAEWAVSWAQRLISACHAALSCMPDELIARMSEKSRKIIADALRVQAARFD